MIWILAVSACGAALSASAQTAVSGEGGAIAAQANLETPLSDAEADATAELELFLPESYEQYLELENPSDFAINDSYIAIADRQSGTSAIYIYDRSAQAYSVLEDVGQSPKSLHFYADGTATYLYYVLSDNNVFRVNLSSQPYEPEQIEGFTCFSMIISGETIFSSRTQGDATIYCSSVDTPTAVQQIQVIVDGTPEDSIKNCNNPVFALFGNSVYLAANTNVYVYNGENFVWQGGSVNIIDSFAVYDTSPLSFRYTAGNGSLYSAVSGITDTPLLDGNDSFSELVFFDGNTYLLNLQNNSVCQLGDNALGEYEIGKYSDSSNRIGAGAADLSVYADTLVIADTNNNRVLLADAQSGATLREIAVTAPTIVCAGEENFIVSDSHYVYLYSYDGGTAAETFPAETFGGTISGCTYAYGKYYVVGAGANANGVIAKNADGEYAYTPAQFSSVATAVTADIYGNIYVLVGTSVLKFTDSSFLEGASEGPAYYAPTGTLRILSDYTGEMYAAAADGIYRLGTVNYEKVLSSDLLSLLVFSNAANLSVFSFAFGFEDSAVYILSDGFIAKADLGADAPASLGSIGAQGLYKSLQSAPAGEDDAASMLVSVPEGSVILPVADMNAITDSTEFFPYTGYARTEETRIGVRICTLDAGTVVAFYRYAPSEQDGSAPLREYTVALVLNDARSAGDDLTVLTDCYTSAASPYTGYTTNEVGLCRFPLLRAGNEIFYAGGTEQRLAKSASVTVYGTVSAPADESASGYGLDFDYYLVATNIGGETVYGFIPANYVLSYDTSAAWENGEFTFRHIKRGESVTLTRAEGTETLELTLSGEELVKVYGEPDENNEVKIEYTDQDGNIWTGMVNADLLYEAGPSTLVILAVVAVVAAAVLVSTCYLILRKQPTLQ